MAYDFVDRILECVPGESVAALKAFALNEEFFQDHFPGKPVVPGAMILEGMIQAARRCLAALPGGHDQWTLHEVENLRFSRFVVPGDTMRLEAAKDGEAEGRPWFRAQAFIGEETVCRVRFGLRSRKEKRPAD